MVLLPLLCLPVNLYAAKKAEADGQAACESPQGGEGGTAELTVQNPTVFPILPDFLPCAAGEPVERRDADRKRERRHLAEEGKRTMKISLQSPWCGRVRLNVESARLYDCFGLIGVKTQLDAHACVVQPDTFLQTPVISPAAAHIDDTEDYSNERPGCDLSEMFQIRDYTKGTKNPPPPPSKLRGSEAGFLELFLPVRPFHGGGELSSRSGIWTTSSACCRACLRQKRQPASAVRRCFPRGTCRKLVASDLRFR